MRRVPRRAVAKPRPEHDRFIDKKERAKDCHIVPGKPDGQIDVEVVCSLGGEAGCQICQGTPALVQGEYGALGENEHSEKASQAKSAQSACDRQGQDAASHDGPDECVREFDCYQHLGSTVSAASGVSAKWNGGTSRRLR